MNKFLSLLVSSAVCVTAFAEGYQINTLSAKQLGMGHTGVALKLGAESMIFNPAALGFSDKTLDISASFTGIKAIGKATHEGNTYSTDNGISTPLAVSAGFKVYDNLQVGISFFTPYGSSLDWGKNWAGAVLNQDVGLKVYTIQPSVAWKITPKLSIGAGMMLAWGTVDLNKALVSPSTLDKVLPVLAAAGQLPPSVADYRFGMTTPASVNLNGKSAIALGANIGVMYDISATVTLGASFRTKMNMKVENGDAAVEYANEIARTILEKDLNIINSANFAASMPCPFVFSFGASWRPVDKLTLAADAQLTGWKTYRNLNIDFLDPMLDPYDQNLTKNYKNSWAVRIGAQYAVTNRLDARLGLMIDTTPVNMQHYNPETPGMTKIGPSAGLSFRPVPSLSIDFGFMYVAGTGADNASCTYTDLLAAKFPALNLPAQNTFTADYSTKAFVPSLGISYSF